MTFILPFIKDFSEFFYKNHHVMWDNIFVFVIWGILCIGLTYSITSKRNVKLQNENKILKNEHDALKKKYAQLDENARLLMGRKNFSSTSAKNVSEQIGNKRKSD